MEGTWGDLVLLLGALMGACCLGLLYIKYPEKIKTFLKELVFLGFRLKYKTKEHRPLGNDKK